MTFEFHGNLEEEVEKVTLGIRGLRDESAKTYQRLIADSGTAFSSLSADNQKLAISIQESINALRDLAVVQGSLDDELEAGTISTGQYTQAKAALTIKEGNLREAISAGMRTLNERIQTESRATDSVMALHKRLRELTTAYYNLSKADREGNAGQGILGQIGELDKEIQTAQGRLSSYSRTAGTGFNGLSMSVQQVARELPSLTMGANMFFLAISNNLPVLADNIRAARIEYDLMKKSGQTAIPVWKQVLTSIVSWQTALVVGITLLSVYGKEILSWAKSLVTGRKSLADAIETLDEFRDKVGEASASTIADLRRMSKEWDNMGANLSAKEKYILENKSAFDKLGVAINDVRGAERLFADGKQAFIDSVLARAKAAAAMGMASEQYKKAIEKMQEADQMKDGRERSYYNYAGAANGGFQKTTFYEKNQDKIDATKKANELFAEADKLVEKYIGYSKESSDKMKQAGLDAADAMVEGSVAQIEASIALKREALKKLTNKADHDKTMKEIETEEKRLEAITGKQGKKENDELQTKERRAQEAANVIKAETAMRELEIDRQKEALAQKEKDAALELRQQNIDLLKDSADKELEQIALDCDRKINEIEKKGREYVLAQQKIEQAAWENANPDWKKKGLVFKPSTPSVSQLPAPEGKELSDATLVADKAREKAEADLLEKTMKQYQDYATKRLEIEKKYNDDIAYLTGQRTETNKAAIDAAIDAASKGKKKALSELSLDELKDTDMWTKMFGDLDKMALPSLEELIKQAKEVNTSAWDPENVKEYQDAIERLEEAVKTRSPFKSIGEDWKKLLKGIKEGNQDDIAGALSGIDTAAQKINGDLNTIAGGIGDIFGDEAGYAAEQVVALTSAIGGFATGAAKIAKGDILGGLASVVSSIGSIFSMGKKVKEMNRQAREEVQKYYDTAIEGEREYQAMLRERQRTQQEIGESTLAYDQRITAELEKQKKANADEATRLMKELQGEQYISGKGYKHGTWFRKAKTWNEYDSLAGKSYEDIEKLYSEGKLEEKASKLFEQLRTLKEEGVDINQMLADQTEAMNEALTGTTTDSIADSIIQGFAAGKRSAADFADDFQSMLNNAVLQGIKMKALEEPLRKWYESFAEASGNGLTEENIASLKEQYDKIIEDAAKQLEDMEKVTGTTIGATDAARTASSKGIQSVSQDSVDKGLGMISTVLIFLDKTSTGVTSINATLTEGLGLLSRIATNTDRLKAIEIYLAIIKNAQMEFKDKGIIYRSR